MNLSLLPPWVKPVAALVLAVSLLSGGWIARGTYDQAKRTKELERTLAAIQDANLRAERASVRLIAELQKPKAGVEIREVVRNNPSQCVVPKPVFDGLLKSVREANAAR